MDPIRRLAGQTAVYGLSSILGRVINFLLVPLYTRVFVASEFGVFSEMYSYVAFLLVILTYGMETAFFRFAQGDAGRKNQVFGTAMVSIMGTTTLFLVLALAFQTPLSALLRHASHPEYITWLALIISLDVINAIPFARLRADNRPMRFAVIKLTGIITSIVFVLFFLLLCPWLSVSGPESLRPFINSIYNPEVGVGYVFIANLIASAVTTVLLLPVMFRSGLGFSPATWRMMMVYALPLVIAGLGGVVNETLDKLLLKFMLPEDIAMAHVGIYSACYKLSILLTIFIQAFRFAAEPFFFSHAKEKDARKTYALIMKYFVLTCLMMFLGVSLFIDIVKHFIGPEFWAGLGIVPVLLLANLFLGVYFNLSIWYKLTGQTGYGAWIALLGAFITIILNIWWIPIWGYHGSAWATMVCYFVMMAVSYMLGQRHYPVPYEVSRLSGFVLAATVMVVLQRMLPDFTIIIYSAINILFVVAFVGFVVIIDPTIIKGLREMRKKSVSL